MSNFYKSGSLGLIDAVAQSFSVTTEGGEYLTSVELYFQSTPNDGLPVTVHIRTMNQGIPTSTVLPFSEVTLPSSDVRTATYSTTGVLSNSTKFTFDTPVYIQQNTEYALCIMANSKDYNLYVSVIGENRIGTNTRITKQPSSGAFFTSQNASTWLPSPYKDLAFKVNRAKFKGTVGTVYLENTVDAPIKMINDPFRVEDVNSGTVIVTHKNHGFKDGDTVYLMNSSWTSAGVDATDSGITLGMINEGTQASGDVIYYISSTIDVLSYDEFTLGGTSGSTSAPGTFGDNDWYLYTVKNYNYLMPMIESLNLNTTAVTYEARVREGLEHNTTGSRNLQTTYSRVDEFEENYYPRVKSIQANPLRSKGSGDVFIKATLLSNNSYQSPIIDLDRTSAVLIQNLVDNDSYDPESGSNISNYVTREVVLNDPAQNLKFYCDTNVPYVPNGESSLEFYYKAGSSDQDFEDLEWEEFDAVTAFVNSSDPDEYTEAEYEAKGLGSFDKYAVKISMKSNNSSYVPTCKNLRVIAYT